MNFIVLFVLFWLYSFLGFLIETLVVSIQNKKFTNRGFLIGPYCPIYGTGAILLLTISNYQNSPFTAFIVSIFICSLVEYLTSYVLELIFKVRWWDYSNYFLNINGRICLLNSICFGLLGMFVVCYLNPFFINLINSLNPFILKIMALLILIITTIDITVTLTIMFDIRKTIVNFKNKTLTNIFKTDATEEVSQRVRSILKEKSFIHKHLSKTFANFKIYRSNLNKKYKLKNDNLESILLISSILSLILGFLIGKLLGKVSLTICIFLTINFFIVKFINRGQDGK